MFNAFPSRPISVKLSDTLELIANGLKNVVSKSSKAYKPQPSKNKMIFYMMYLQGFFFHITYKLVAIRICSFINSFFLSSSTNSNWIGVMFSSVYAPSFFSMNSDIFSYAIHINTICKNAVATMAAELIFFHKSPVITSAHPEKQ